MKYAVVLAAACGDVHGLGGDLTPLETIHVNVDAQLSAHAPRVALVWGMQWLPEFFCVQPNLDPGALTAQQMGCRYPFGFVPLRVDASAPLEDDGTGGLAASIDLYDVPNADVLVGDVTARVGYASFVVFDDLDGDGTLKLARPNRINVGPMMGPPDTTPTDQKDKVLAGSFARMTAPDQRLAYREGAFVPDAFYPRQGCGDPLPGFSVLGASGFTNEDQAEAAILAGMLPTETDTTQCSQTPLETTSIAIGAAQTDDYQSAVTELGCTERTADGSVRWLEPTADEPDIADRLTACIPVPDDMTGAQQLVVTGKSTDACKGVNHFVLKGCREDPNCGTPDWDHSLAPPTWWPCK